MAHHDQRTPGQANTRALLERLGVSVDPELLVLSLTHRSFAYEAGGLPTNERLEFLGDSVLGLVVTDQLYRRHPDLPEGDLAKMRAATVSQRALAEVARDINLGAYILLGKGETSTGGVDKDSILCDALEAVLGAIYLSHGMDVTRGVIERLMEPLMVRAALSGAGLDWKTSLQEICVKQGLPAPEYQVVGEGPDHQRVFTAQVIIGAEVRGEGTGTAKKHAEQAAAEAAYLSLTAQE